MPRRAEEDDGVVDVLAAKTLQRLEVLGEDAQRTRVVAVEELLVLVGERTAVSGSIGEGRHARADRAKSMKPRSTSVCDELDAHAIADVEALESAHDPAFGGRPGNAHPGSLVRRAGDDGVEALADARFEQQRRGRLAHLPLHLGGVVLLLGAVPGQRGELVVACRAPAARRAPP